MFYAKRLVFTNAWFHYFTAVLIERFQFFAPLFASFLKNRYNMIYPFLKIGNFLISLCGYNLSTKKNYVWSAFWIQRIKIHVVITKAWMKREDWGEK